MTKEKNKINQVIFTEEEFQKLYGDLIKISRSLTDGCKCGFQELKTVIEQIAEKNSNQKEYKQVVID